MIPDDVRIGTFERWDSLAHLRLVLAIEQKIGRQLDPGSGSDREPGGRRRAARAGGVSA